MPARRLPKAIKDRHGRLKQVLRRMNAAPFVAEKRTFQMNAEGLSLRGIILG
jgi:hypothetical protein